MALSSWTDLVESAKDAPSGFTPLPEGQYNFHVIESKLVESKSGKTGYNINAEVLDGDNQGRKVFNTFYVSPESPQAMRIFFDQIGTLGLDEEFFNQGPDDDDILNALSGATFVGKVIHVNNPNNPEKPYVNIDGFQPLEGGAPVSTGPKGPGASKPAVTKTSGLPTPGGGTSRPAVKRKLPGAPGSSPV